MVTPKNDKLPKMRIEEKIGYTKRATQCDPRSGKMQINDIKMDRNGPH